MKIQLAYYFLQFPGWKFAEIIASSLFDFTLDLGYVMPACVPLTSLDHLEVSLQEGLVALCDRNQVKLCLECSYAKTLPQYLSKIMFLPGILGLVSALVYLCIFSSEAIHEL